MTSQNKIIAAVHERIDKVLPQKTIQDVLSLCTEYITEEVLEDRTISIENFGTFSIANQIYDKEKFMKVIKLRPASSFKYLLKVRRSQSKDE